MIRWSQTEIKELLAKKLTVKDFTEAMELRGTLVVEPGMITTMECRGDQSRFYIRTDDNNRVISGNFG